MELWKPVVGFEGIYEVSDIGNIKRVAPWSDGRKRKLGLLSVYPNQRGYVKARLFRDGKVTDVRVHRLVMAAFVGPLPYNHEINHKNGVRNDNRLDN